MGIALQSAIHSFRAPGTPIIARQVTPTTIIKQVSQAQTTVQPSATLQRSPGVQVAANEAPAMSQALGLDVLPTDPESLPRLSSFWVVLPRRLHSGRRLLFRQGLLSAQFQGRLPLPQLPQ
ncbi:hypothetical protein P7K49_010027 [Saguinus oedipus]|uniref:Uncharacterized protein n=1 Tax=Saguinus oedipus TaxID=9490 RepID=A0ABQ9VLL9_SAGOE|nr:hypothetical protein P7K49_010027 [Saguinus oedipus]